MRTDNPILLERHRGGSLESIHRGAWVLAAPDGTVIEHAGEPSQSIFARSAMKSLQALPLLESGAADAFGFDDRNLALALASHSGEPRHVDVASDGLAKIGLTSDSLLCGPQKPANTSADASAERIINNCSGKHVGFLAVAVQLGLDPSSYLDPNSGAQSMVRSAVAEMTDTTADELGGATDGCSAPTFRMPLVGLATGLARMTNPDSLAPPRAEACRRLTKAAMRHPVLVAGTHERFCTDLIAATRGRIFGKIGAEGVYTFGVVGESIGFAGKADDGDCRGLYPVMLDLLQRRGLVSAAELSELARWAGTSLRNWDGIEVGHVHITAPWPKPQ